MSRFPGEGDISFPPTYRYERGSRDSYMWQKFKTTGVSSYMWTQMGNGDRGTDGAGQGAQPSPGRGEALGPLFTFFFGGEEEAGLGESILNVKGHL